MIARILSEPHAGIGDDLYDLLAADQIAVPAHWSVEIANALYTNIRRGRIVEADVDGIVHFLSKIQVTIVPPVQLTEIGPLTRFATAHTLTAYDAAYVQIALHHGCRLATLDRDMRAAGRRLGISLLPD